MSDFREQTAQLMPRTTDRGMASSSKRLRVEDAPPSTRFRSHASAFPVWSAFRVAPSPELTIPQAEAIEMEYIPQNAGITDENGLKSIFTGNVTFCGL